jgi:hypothetical protein
MLRNHRATLSLPLIAGLTASLLGFSQAAETGRPARVEQIQGSDLNRVVLTPRAAERLALRTAPVREEVVMRWLTVEAAVEAMLTDLPPERAGIMTAGLSSPVRVPVPLLNDPSLMSGLAVPVLSLKSKDGLDDDDDDDDDVAKTDRGGDKVKDKLTPDFVFVMPMGGSQLAKRLRAKLLDVAPASGASGLPLAYYVVDQQDPKAALRVGQRVQVRVPQPGSGTPQRVVPYSAVIYDARGGTWVYGNPKPLVYVRHRIDVEYVQDDVAVLKDGPGIGTEVVVAGAVELHGIEQKFGQ